MKKSNLFLIFTLLASLTLGLVGCNKKPTTTNNEATTTNPAPGTTTDPVTNTTTDPVTNPTTDPIVTTDPMGQTVVHQNPFVTALENASQVRKYNEKFDTMVNDFSTASSANVKNALRVLVDTELVEAPVTPDVAIYKMATGSYEIHTYDAISFKIRTVGEGTLSLENLVLALRGDDAWDVYEISLKDALNQDGDTLPELTNEYQVFSISPTLSIEDDSTEYQLKGNAGNSGTKVTDKILGFHLYATGDCSQVIEIESVCLVKSAEEVVLDSFNRENANAGDSKVCWWRGTTGFIVQQGVLVNAANSFTADLNDAEGANLVLNVMGDTTGATVGGVQWANLKDAEGNSVSNAVNGAYYSVVINLANSGITAKEVVVASTTDLYISKVFVSDLNDREAVSEYPLIDAKNISMFDNFNRTQSGFDDDYDKSSTSEVVINAGLYYALSYHNGNMITVADGVLTFDATNLEAGDYINFKEGKSAYNGERYLVMVAKGVNGATLNGLGIDLGSDPDYVFYNSWVSAFGLKVPQLGDESYSYYNPETGYSWVIIDLEETGIEAGDYISFVYRGVGQLLIDAVFYADEVGKHVEYTEKEVLKMNNVDISSGYNYGGQLETTSNLVKFVFTADEGLTLGSFRVEGANGLKWFKDGDFKDANGNAIDHTQALNGLTIVVDLQASDLVGGGHIHAGDGIETGSFSFVCYSLEVKENEPQVEYVDKEIYKKENADITPGYAYCGEFTPTSNLMKLVFTADEGITLTSLRLEHEGTFKFFSAGEIIDAEGNPIDSTQTLNGLTLVIDLEATGLSGKLHLHSGNDGLETGKFSVTVYSIEEKQEPVDYDKLYNKNLIKTVEQEMNDYYGAGEIKSSTNLVLIEFQATGSLTLRSFRFETWASGSGVAKWFENGEVIGADGKAIPWNQDLNGLKIIVDLEASGLQTGGNMFLHIGGKGETGSYTINFYEITEKMPNPAENYELKQIYSSTTFTYSDYEYAGSFTSTTNLVAIEFTASAGITNKSFRFEGSNGAKWFKDGDVVDAEGNAISGELSLNGLVVVIDLEASGLNIGENHVHTGGMGENGTFSFKVYECSKKVERHTDIMNSLVQ